MSLDHETPEEKNIFSVIFKSCLKENQNSLDMERFRNLFKESDLPKETLKILYVQSVNLVPEQEMNRKAFGIFCKFLFLEMANLPVTLEHLQTKVPLPHFIKEEFQKLQMKPENYQEDITNPQWDSKFEISETLAREYVFFFWSFVIEGHLYC